MEMLTGLRPCSWAVCRQMDIHHCCVCDLLDIMDMKRPLPSLFKFSGAVLCVCVWFFFKLIRMLLAANPSSVLRESLVFSSAIRGWGFPNPDLKSDFTVARKGHGPPSP